MADHKEGNGESAAAIDAKQSQQYVSVFRAEGEVLQGISRLVSIERLAHRYHVMQSCEFVTHVSGNAVVGIVMLTPANHARREPPHRLASNRARRIYHLRREYLTELVTTRRTRAKWRSVVCFSFSQSSQPQMALLSMDATRNARYKCCPIVVE